jgi:hypothetical protein
MVSFSISPPKLGPADGYEGKGGSLQRPLFSGGERNDRISQALEEEEGGYFSAIHCTASMTTKPSVPALEIST